MAATFFYIPDISDDVPKSTEEFFALLRKKFEADDVRLAQRVLVAPNATAADKARAQRTIDAGGLNEVWVSLTRACGGIHS